MNKAEEKHFDSEFLDRQREQGFSLIEVTIALVILLVALLGVFVTFAYAVNYNSGNNSRAQALAVLRQQVELLRSAKFTPEITDANLIGGTRAEELITAADGSRFRVALAVDNDLATSGIQSTSESTTTIKEITLLVTPAGSNQGWQASLPATVILRRVRAN